MKSGEWSLLFRHCLLEQLERLKAAADKAFANDPRAAQDNANIKLYDALAKLILETIPDDPARDEYRQGNTMGLEFRHWRRAKIGRRFRLFFRYDSRTKVIVYAWGNDESKPRRIHAARRGQQARSVLRVSKNVHTRRSPG